MFFLHFFRASDEWFCCSWFNPCGWRLCLELNGTGYCSCRGKWHQSAEKTLSLLCWSFPPPELWLFLKSFKSVMWSNSVRCSSSVTSNIAFVLKTEVQSFYINLLMIQDWLVLTSVLVCCASVLCLKGCSLHPYFLYYAKVELVHFKS